MMTRNELKLLIDKAESRQRIINMELALLYNRCLKAKEDYSDEPMQYMRQVNEAINDVDNTLGDLT